MTAATVDASKAASNATFFALAALAHLNGQRSFAAGVAEFARQNDSVQIIAPDYATASMLRFYAPSDMTVAHIAGQPRYAGSINTFEFRPACARTAQAVLLLIR
jgi:hypothetical protein